MKTYKELINGKYGKRKKMIGEWSVDIESMIEDCTNRQEKLSEWEALFIQSIIESSEYGLSAKQIATLEKIWERVT